MLSILSINFFSISLCAFISYSFIKVSDKHIYGKVKQSFIHDVVVLMNTLLNQIHELNKKEKFEDNLFVKNIIVNKDKSKKIILPYIATDRWIGQLGNRLQINS